MTTYNEFLERKLHTGAEHGFEPIWMPPQLFDFQQSLVTAKLERRLAYWRQREQEEILKRYRAITSI